MIEKLNDYVNQISISWYKLVDTNINLTYNKTEQNLVDVIVGYEVGNKPI